MSDWLDNAERIKQRADSDAAMLLVTDEEADRALKRFYGLATRVSAVRSGAITISRLRVTGPQFRSGLSENDGEGGRLGGAFGTRTISFRSSAVGQVTIEASVQEHCYGTDAVIGEYGYDKLRPIVRGLSDPQRLSMWTEELMLHTLRWLVLEATDDIATLLPAVSLSNGGESAEPRQTVDHWSITDGRTAWSFCARSRCRCALPKKCWDHQCTCILEKVCTDRECTCDRPKVCPTATCVCGLPKILGDPGPDPAIEEGRRKQRARKKTEIALEGLVGLPWAVLAYFVGSVGGCVHRMGKHIVGSSGAQLSYAYGAFTSTGVAWAAVALAVAVLVSFLRISMVE